MMEPQVQTVNCFEDAPLPFLAQILSLKNECSSIWVARNMEHLPVTPRALLIIELITFSFWSLPALMEIESKYGEGPALQVWAGL